MLSFYASLWVNVLQVKTDYTFIYTWQLLSFDRLVNIKVQWLKCTSFLFPVNFFFFLTLHDTCTFQDFQNAAPSCPGYVVTAFEMIEMLKNQGPEGVCTMYKIKGTVDHKSIQHSSSSSFYSPLFKLQKKKKTIIAFNVRRMHTICVASFWMLCDFRVWRRHGLADHLPQFHATALNPAG